MYTPNWAERKNQTQLPDKAKCTMCNRLKSLAAFSKKQQENLRSGLMTGRIRNTEAAKNGKHVKCIECTGTQKQELQCSGCDLWKALDSFSKAQRKHGDDARCQVCMSIQEQATVIPTATEWQDARKVNTVDDDGTINSDDSGDEGGGSIVTNQYAQSTVSGVEETLEKLSVASPSTSEAANYRFYVPARRAAQSTSNAAINKTYLPPHLRRQAVSRPSSTPGPPSSRATTAAESSDEEQSFVTVKSSRSRILKTQAQRPFATGKELGTRGITKAIVFDDNGGRQASDSSDYDSDDGPRMGTLTASS